MQELYQHNKNLSVFCLLYSWSTLEEKSNKMSEQQEQENETNPVNKIIKVCPIIVDDDKNTTLHYAAAAGDEEGVQKEIESGQKLDVENYLGWTPLMMAVRNEHLHITKLLIENRADATRKNKFGLSVFLISITSGKLEMVSYLLQHLLSGGISRQSIQRIFSPISIAILFNRIDIVKYLIEMSFNVNCATAITGITPLMIAAAMNLKDIYTLLAENGARIDQKNILGHTVDMQTKRRRPKPPPERLCIPQMPLILVSPQPFLFHSPVPQNCPPLRKSSDTLSPAYLPPNVTPIPHTVSFCPQYFFPPDFSPNHPFATLSPAPPNSFYNSSDLMNTRMNQSSFLSTLPQQNFSSPCA